jgi:hypothetical protein
MGKQSMFRTYDFEKGVPQVTPIYYIDNETEEVVAVEKWRCSHRNKYEFAAHAPNQLIECEYENGHVESVTVKTK